MKTMWRESRHLPVALLIVLPIACGVCSRKNDGTPAVPADGSVVDWGADSDAAGVPHCMSGAKACPEILYPREHWRPQVSLAVDDRYLYWMEYQAATGNFVVMAPKDGSGPVTKLGEYGGADLDPTVIIVDATRVYWKSGRQIRSVPRGGGQQEEIDLGPGIESGSLYDGGDSLFSWVVGCRSVVRVAKNGVGALTTWAVTQDAFLGGGTGVAGTPETLFCGNMSNIWAVDRSSGTVRQVLSDQDSIVPLVLVGKDMYFVNNRRQLGTRTDNLAVLSDGATTASDLGRTGASVAVMLHDAKRRRLYWVTGRGSNHFVGTYSLDNRTISFLADGQESWGGVAMDDDYIYWQGDYTILRLRKTD